MEKLKHLSDKLKLSWRLPGLNKYSIAVFIFCIWIGFIDRYSIVNQFKLSKSVKRLETAKADYEKQLEDALKQREVINSDIEKFARETYLFHKDNEKIILVNEN